MNKKGFKVGLALGGGGVRGLAHIGVIKALGEDIPIDILAGTSMGALIGAEYALKPDIYALEKTILELVERKEVREIEKMISSNAPAQERKLIIESLVSFVKKLYVFNLRAIKKWVFSGKEISWIFDALGLNVDFSEAKVPFSCMAVDLRTGEEVVMDKGNIKEAVLASVSLPGVFPPVKKDKKLLVDGGIVCSVPVDAAVQMGADFIISVVVEAQVDYTKKLGNGLDIMFQADAIRAYKLCELKIQASDVIIYPEVGMMSWADFSRAAECIKAGEKAAEKLKPQIIQLIKKKKRDKFWKGIFPFAGK